MRQKNKAQKIINGEEPPCDIVSTHPNRTITDVKALVEKSFHYLKHCG